jgi:hypothetical protein
MALIEIWDSILEALTKFPIYALALKTQGRTGLEIHEIVDPRNPSRGTLAVCVFSTLTSAFNFCARDGGRLCATIHSLGELVQDLEQLHRGGVELLYHDPLPPQKETVVQVDEIYVVIARLLPALRARLPS